MMKNLKVGSKTGLKYFGYKDIQGWEPCYDSIKCISKDNRITAIDVLKAENVSFEDKLWVVLRPEIVSEKLMRLFAVWCYRETLKFITNPDPRSIEAANVAEKFANGKATEEELAIASNAAWSSAKSATKVTLPAAEAARSAAFSAAETACSSARHVSQAAAQSAAQSAAYSAIESADQVAVWSARSSAKSAKSAAESPARSAAWSVVRSAQKEKLIEMILAEATERKRSKKK